MKTRRINIPELLKIIDEIKYIKIDLKQSNTDIANELNVTSNTVNKWLSGDIVLSDFRIYQLKKYVKEHKIKSDKLLSTSLFDENYIARNIYYTRKYFKMSLKKFAKQIGANSKLIGDWEKHKTIPKEWQLRKVGKVFNVHYLYFGSCVNSKTFAFQTGLMSDF